MGPSRVLLLSLSSSLLLLMGYYICMGRLPVVVVGMVVVVVHPIAIQCLELHPWPLVT